MQLPITRWLAHIRALAEDIGPRGSTTEGERQGSLYCQAVLAHLGLNPTLEPFRGARSIYHPHLLAAVLIFLAWLIYPRGGRVSAGIAAFLSFVVVVSEVLELSFRPNPLRWMILKGPSQNVVAQIPAAGEHQQDLILIGHVDTHRTPVMFKSRRWFSAYKVFILIAFMAFVLQTVIYLLGTATGAAWVWPASTGGAVCAFLLAAMCLHADHTPFSPGANDNASGAGLVLTLAEHLVNVPLAHTRVWLVCTGCEEVRHYGASAFFARHRSEFHRPVAVAFELLGTNDPAWLVQEGVIMPFRASPHLVALAERLAGEHPEWGAAAARTFGGNTEMADALKLGIPAITLIGLGEQGEGSHWHQIDDTADKMVVAVLERAWAFTWTFIQALEAAVATRPPDTKS